MGFLNSVFYFLISGALSFVGGRLFSNADINYNAFPYVSFSFEKEGKIYKKLGIAKWQNRVPDMSRIFKKIMPAKKLDGKPETEKLSVMIKETCIAEMTHWALIVSGIAYLSLWEGIGGFICFILSVFINLVFIIIQRYNRPRLIRLFERKTGSARNKDTERSNTECAF